jgi:hypothetical protein
MSPGELTRSSLAVWLISELKDARRDPRKPAEEDCWLDGLGILNGLYGSGVNILPLSFPKFTQRFGKEKMS